MNLRSRLTRLEGRHGSGQIAGPDVILVAAAHADGSQTMIAALLRGGGGLIRNAGESEDAFTTRALSLAGRPTIERGS